MSLASSLATFFSQKTSLATVSDGAAALCRNMAFLPQRATTKKAEKVGMYRFLS